MVLDTNTTLACWWFLDPAVTALVKSIEDGRLRWLATTPMRDELRVVLDRGLPTTAVVTPPGVLETFDRLSRRVGVAACAGRLLCSDRSDQMFIDLAVAHRTSCLFSRDRAVLKLRRRARAWGVDILRPDGWSPPPAVAHA